MTRLTIVLTAALAALPSAAMAQHVNWRSLEGGDRHLVTAYLGADMGSYYGLSYEVHVPRAFVPLAIGGRVTVPFGSESFDDWQIGIGARGEAWHGGALSVSVGSTFQLRRFASPLALLYSAGMNTHVAVGLTGRRWSTAAIAGYDQAMLTHIEQRRMRDYHPGARDGWYDDTGGTFRFGLSTGFATASWGATLTTGRMFGRDFRDNPTLPFFAELALRKSL